MVARAQTIVVLKRLCLALSVAAVLSNASYVGKTVAEVRGTGGGLDRCIECCVLVGRECAEHNRTQLRR